jgi:hypothetical protein
MSVEVGRSEYEQLVNDIGEFLMERDFRPEVLLASYQKDEEGNPEVGNFILTAPEKKHPSVPFLGKLYEVLLLFISKWQLHIRIFYDKDEDKLHFHVHREKNAYSPLYAKEHYRAEGFDIEHGKKLFRERYLPEMNESILKDFNYEVNHE